MNSDNNEVVISTKLILEKERNNKAFVVKISGHLNIDKISERNSSKF